MHIAYKTDVGRQREKNEDSILVDQGNGIFLLADGLGGHLAGEVASLLCINTIHSYLAEKIHILPQEDIPGLMTRAVVHAHEVIKEKAGSDPKLLGMGTTVVAMTIKDSDSYICHVGDSRAYLVRAGIRQITRDHSAADRFENDVVLNTRLSHKRSSILSQAVGTGISIKPEVNHIKLLKGDIILICSDGLTDSLSDEEIDAIILEHEREINRAADRLLEEANSKGGPDNISVILVQNAG